MKRVVPTSISLKFRFLAGESDVRLWHVTDGRTDTDALGSFRVTSSVRVTCSSFEKGEGCLYVCERLGKTFKESDKKNGGVGVR